MWYYVILSKSNIIIYVQFVCQNVEIRNVESLKNVTYVTYPNSIKPILTFQPFDILYGYNL
jgi:hypothetical protein